MDGWMDGARVGKVVGCCGARLREEKNDEREGEGIFRGGAVDRFHRLF